MNFFQRKVLFLVTFLFSLFYSHLMAWSTLNGIAICTVINQKYYPVIASDGSGGTIIAWEDARNGLGNVNIYAQRVNSSGSTLWTLNGVPVSTAVNEKYYPAIVSDGSGGAIITWEDERNGSTFNIYAQRVNSNGSTLWTLNGVAICTAIGGQDSPIIVSDTSGGAIIAWEDARNGLGNGNIYAQRVNSSGITLWTTNGAPINTVPGNLEVPTIVSDGVGGAIITWMNIYIYAQRVSSSGSTLWTLNGVTICTAVNGQEYPTIVGDGSSGAIITWMDQRNGDFDIYAQRVNSIGSTLWTLNGVTICTIAGDQELPMIVSDGMNGAIITWYNYPNGSTYNIGAQRVNSAGSTLWTLNGVAICTAAPGVGQMNPTIVSDGTGGAIITWMDTRNGDLDIYAQRVNSSGSILWTLNGVPICTAINNQSNPTIISDGTGGAIITWQDERNGLAYNIYAQQINANGLIVSPTSINKQIWELWGE